MDYQIVSLSLGPKPNFLGLLMILSTKPIGDVDIAALEHASTVISLELVKDQAIFDTQQRFKGEFVSELFSGQMDETLMNKAKGLNFKPNYYYVAVIINYNAAANERHGPNDGLTRKIIHLTNHFFIEKHTPGITVMHQNQIVILLSYQSNSSRMTIVSQIKDKAKKMQREISERNWKLDACFGISGNLTVVLTY